MTPEGETLLGVTRLASVDDDRRAEYAIVVRTDMKGRGLGYLLFRRLLARAEERGIEEVWGDVLHDNEAMLRMCRELGFAVKRHPVEPELVRVTKRLSRKSQSEFR